jgi:hypothetical protein
MRSIFSWFKQTEEYTQVAGSVGPDPDLGDEKVQEHQHVPRHYLWLTLAILLVTALLSGALGFSIAGYGHGQCVPAWADSIPRCMCSTSGSSMFWLT